MTDYILPKSSENWNNEDHYNHYLQTKRFGFSFIKNFDKNEYDKIKQTVKEYKKLYFFIYNKLPKDNKNEFKFDFLDNLVAIKEKQTLTKFKEIISNLITEIDDQPYQKIAKKDFFIDKYESDNWQKYENESNLFNTATEKITYWNNKLLEYQKDKINLDFSGTIMLSLDVKLKKPKNLTGILFDEFCQKNIDLLNLDNQQKGIENSYKAKKELHNNIFKGNAFEVWQSMFDRFKITESQYSTDIDFMFEVMKYNKLIHENIRLTDIKKWINNVHEISFEKIRYTNPKSSANEKRLIIYNEIISK